MTLPTSAGSNTNLLQTDGNGVTSWRAIAATDMPFITGSASYSYAKNPSGFGSAGTTTVKFTSQTGAGSDITYTASSTNGDIWTINTVGLYSITLTLAGGTADLIGITVNGTNSSSVLTQRQTSFLTVPAFTQYASSTASSCSVTLYLAVNDVIRAQVDGASALFANNAYGILIRRLL